LMGDRFTFFGFLARRGRERAETINSVVECPHVAVVYEAPGRVAGTLTALADAGASQRRAVVARELTKLFEDVRRGTVADLAAYYADEAPRGEVVIVVEGKPEAVRDETVWRERVAALRTAGVAPRAIVAMLVRDEGAPRNLAYRLAHGRNEHDHGPADGH